MHSSSLRLNNHLLTGLLPLSLPPPMPRSLPELPQGCELPELPKPWFEDSQLEELPRGLFSIVMEEKDGVERLPSLGTVLELPR